MLGLWLSFMLIGLGLLWLRPLKNVSIGAVFALGFGARILAFSLPAVEEVDFWRFFWDGRQALYGWSPWARPVPSSLSEPAFWTFARAPENTALWSHIRADTSSLSTIYAPLAVCLFALLDILPGPPSLAYALSFLMADGTALWMLRRDRHALWFMALNPLLIWVTYNGLHFDIWLMPLLIAFAFAQRQGRAVQALIWLCLAIALRHWALILLPLWAGLSWRRIRPWMLVPLAGTALSFLPQLIPYAAYHSGLRVYGRLWEMNDALFLLTKALFGGAGARVLALGAALLVALILGLRRVEVARAAALSTVTLLLLSPTFFPWYALWFAPFVALMCGRLRLILSALFVVLPLYYLRFTLEDWGRADVFDTWFVWLEFGPILAALLWWGLAHARCSHHPRIERG